MNNQKKEILKQIDDNNKQIDIINKSKKATINKLTLKLKSIELQNRLLINIKNQITEISKNLTETTSQVDSLSILIDTRRNELIRIYKSYFKKLKRKNDLLILLLSSNSINQAYIRLKMYKNLVNYFNKQISLLNENKLELEQKRSNYVLFLKELKLKENEYQKTITTLNKEKNELEATKRDLEKKKIELTKEISNKKKALALIDNEIKRIIEENAKALKSMNKENTKRYNELSNIFKENKGKLPPPAINSNVLNYFGESNHPILKNVKVKNNGIDLILNNSSAVKAIHKGEVKKIFNVPYGGRAIIIRHGEYLSVYSNLSEVNVKVGQLVNAGDNLGSVMKQTDNTLVLHFEIWNEKEPENPLDWLKF
ncbi:MAG: peptidoglycan DD-metalloendopeptidase family protein [Deferribacterales bacterium]|nr:peptidoglycan DD-metalloendopeptidase family protein [Deferribacterales bacterium]